MGNPLGRGKGRRHLVVAAILGTVLVAGTAKALDLFLSVPNIAGDSAGAGHVAWIDVTSYQFSSSRTPAATEPVIDEILTTQSIDRSMTFLFKAFAAGTVIPTVVFEAQKPGASPQVVKRITLSSARVMSIRQQVSGGATGTQQVSWRFAAMQMEYIPATGAPIVTTYP